MEKSKVNVTDLCIETLADSSPLTGLPSFTEFCGTSVPMEFGELGVKLILHRGDKQSCSV